MTTPNEFCLSTYASGIPMAAGTTISILLTNKGIPVDPDSAFAEFSSVKTLGNGAQRGMGLPTATWHWSHLNEAQRRALRNICPGASAHVYIRIPLNDTDLYGELEWATFDCYMWWPVREETKEMSKQVLDVTIQFKSMVQVE